jgi:hypothetical protein
MTSAAATRGHTELHELAGIAEDALDNETYEQFRAEELDLPDDAEMSVTAGTVRKLFKVFAEIDRLQKSPRFANTYCSQCGQNFGPGDSGFSHCEDHRLRDPNLRDAIRDAIAAQMLAALRAVRDDDTIKGLTATMNAVEDAIKLATGAP